MSQSKKKAAGAYKAPLTLLYAGIAAQAFGIAALALVSRRVLDEGGSPWGWVLLFLALALPLLDGGLDLLSGRTVDRAAVSLRRDTLDTLLSKDAEAYSRYHSGQVFSRLTQDAYTVCEWRIAGRPQVAGQLIRLLCAASALFFVNIPLALAVVGAGALAIAGGRLLRKYLTRRHLRVRQAEEGLTGCTQEILEHTELLRSMTAGEEAVRRFEGRQKEWLRERKRLRVFSTGVGTGFSAILQLGYAVLLVWGGIAIREGRLSFGDLAALLQLLAMFQSPLTGLSGVQSRLAAFRAAEARLDELYSLPGRRRDSLRGRTTSFAPSYLKMSPFPMRARNSLFCGTFPRVFRSIAGPASREYPGAEKARFSALFWGCTTRSRAGYIWKQSEGTFHAPPLCGDCSAMSHRRPGSFPAAFAKICCWQSPRRMTPPFGRCWSGRNAALSATCPTALKPS